MLGQLTRNRAPHLGHALRMVSQSGAELLWQPRFRLGDGALVAVQATAAHRRLGLNRHRTLSVGRETRDVGRDGEMLRRACRIAAACGHDPAPVLSLRITEAQAASGMLARLIGEVLCDTGLEPERMELEFCEGSLQADAADMLYTLAALRDLGVGLVLGGFGSGVSSLTLLRRRSLAGLLSGLKLDELLLRERGCSDDGFLGGLIASAHALGLVVLAEGIESEQQHRRLREAGCDQGLGSGLGEPMPASAACVEEWARSQQASRSGVAPGH